MSQPSHGTVDLDAVDFESEVASPLADFDSIETVMRAHRTLGVPYSEEEVAGGEATARAQAQAIADEIVIQVGPEGLADKQIGAIIAYLARLGTDITKPEPIAVEEEIGPTDTAVEAEVTEGAQ